MKIEEYVIRSGSTEELNDSDLHENVKFFLKHLPRSLRETGKLIDLERGAISLSHLETKEALKLFAKYSLMIGPSYLKNGRAFIVDLVDNRIFVLDDKSAIRYLAIETFILIPILMFELGFNRIKSFMKGPK